MYVYWFCLPFSVFEILLSGEKYLNFFELLDICYVYRYSAVHIVKTDKIFHIIFSSNSIIIPTFSCSSNNQSTQAYTKFYGNQAVKRLKYTNSLLFDLYFFMSWREYFSVKDKKTEWDIELHFQSIANLITEYCSYSNISHSEIIFNLFLHIFAWQSTFP